MDFTQAAEEIKASRYEFDNISKEDIAKAIENYLDELIDEINGDPLGFFSNNYHFWQLLNARCKNEEE